MEPSFATARLEIPVNQARTTAQALGQAAADHETTVREALIGQGNGSGSCLGSSLATLVRATLELLAIQAWLVEASLTSEERIFRWFGLECIALRSQWTMVRPGISHRKNPALAALVADADFLGIPRDHAAAPKWIGAPVPSATCFSGRLLAKFAEFEPSRGARIDAELGELMYRLLSGSVHGSAAHLLAAHSPTGNVSQHGLPVMSYGLSGEALWRTLGLLFIATFCARINYAKWLGIAVPAEPRRLHLLHIERAIDNLR